MNRYKYNGTGNNGTLAWLLQRISGVILILVILTHFFSMLKGTEIGMQGYVVGSILVFATYHTMNGFKMVTDDYVSSTVWRGILYGIYWILGVALVILGLKAF